MKNFYIGYQATIKMESVSVEQPCKLQLCMWWALNLKSKNFDSQEFCFDVWSTQFNVVQSLKTKMQLQISITNVEI